MFAGRCQLKAVVRWRGMRRGCGCLMVVLTLGVLLAALVWAGMRIFEEPGLSHVIWTPADHASAQRKIQALAAPRGRPAEVVLSERELTALAASYLAEHADQPIADVSIRLPGPRRVQAAVRLPARLLAEEVGLARAADLVPHRWRERPIWVRLELSVQMTRDRRQLRLPVERLHLGRLRVPAWLHRLVLSPAVLGLLQWNLPAGVGTIRVEPGRAVVRPAE